VDVLGLTKRVNEGLEKSGLKAPIRVAVMGCVVNGPGEAREADLGIAAGKGYGQLIVNGQVQARRIPEAEIVDVLVAEARKMADERAAEADAAPEPATTGAG
jgi:(E)-4-hydroxy-3-methylbut-2-enyl-diphosphate synthase